MEAEKLKVAGEIIVEAALEEMAKKAGGVPVEELVEMIAACPGAEKRLYEYLALGLEKAIAMHEAGEICLV